MGAGFTDGSQDERAAYTNARSGVPKTCQRPNAQGRRRWHPPHSRATWCPKSRAPWLLGHCSASFGPEASAGAVASALTAGSIVVDLNDMLEKAAVKDLPYHLRPQPALFQLLSAANKSAQEAVPVRKAYTYVDLTHKDVLPLWMGSEAVGGHTPRPGEFDLDPNADTASLGALGKAFKGALEKPRYFRNMVQWSAVTDDVAHGAVTCKPNV